MAAVAFDNPAFGKILYAKDRQSLAWWHTVNEWASAGRPDDATIWIIEPGSATWWRADWDGFRFVLTIHPRPAFWKEAERILEDLEMVERSEEAAAYYRRQAESYLEVGHRRGAAEAYRDARRYEFDAWARYNALLSAGYVEGTRPPGFEAVQTSFRLQH